MKAAATSTGNPLQADEITELDRYWVFPVHNIGACGVIVDRGTGHAFSISGALERELWIWGYEHDLLGEPAADLVIEQVADLDRAMAALRTFARVRRTDLDQLPLVLRGCAGWMAIRPLFEAGDALVWRVEGRLEGADTTRTTSR